ncbi:MAG: protein-disulfide reductase DsbD N-terminal domain-containing protein [Burkholderiales bacterium]|nr:protein-disulfide reductase DsbD N-terminal domain-containing protein [Burkholderiales bacterium]
MISFRNFLAPRFLAIFSSMMLLLSVHTQVHADEEYLEPTAAFAFSAAMLDGHTVGVTFRIAKGYYMYRERLKFAITGAKLGTVQLPAGKVKFDETFQKDVETYRDQLQIKIPVEGNGPFTLTVTSQGCADAGLCYSPMESTTKLVASGAVKSSATSSANDTPSATTASASQPVSAPSPASTGATVVASAATATEATNVSAAGEKKNSSASVASEKSTAKAACSTAAKGGDSDSSGVESALKGGKLLAILPLFLGIGRALAFTPCGSRSGPGSGAEGRCVELAPAFKKN